MHPPIETLAIFSAQSPVALATIEGVLVEVPVMLTLVKMANNTKGWFVIREKYSPDIFLNLTNKETCL